MADDEWNDDVPEFEEGSANGANGESEDAADDSRSADDSEWRFSLADLEDDEEDEDEAGGFSLYADVKAGSPSGENALFVGLGLALGLVVVLQLFL
mgnify:CR=1 FL=1